MALSEQAKSIIRLNAKREVTRPNLGPGNLPLLKHEDKETGCYTAHIYQQRYYTRGEFQRTYTTYASAKCK